MAISIANHETTRWLGLGFLQGCLEHAVMWFRSPHFFGGRYRVEELLDIELLENLLAFSCINIADDTEVKVSLAKGCQGCLCVVVRLYLCTECVLEERVPLLVGFLINGDCHPLWRYCIDCAGVAESCWPELCAIAFVKVVTKGRLPYIEGLVDRDFEYIFVEQFRDELAVCRLDRLRIYEDTADVPEDGCPIRVTY